MMGTHKVFTKKAFLYMNDFYAFPLELLGNHIFFKVAKKTRKQELN